MSSRVSIRKLSSFISQNGRRSTLEKFLEIDCKSSKIHISDAQYFFDHMLAMRPSPPISCFSTLLGALVKCRHFSLAVSFYKTLDISGVLGSRSDFSILNILLNCYSKMRLRSAPLSAFGLILKNGYHPNIGTFNPLFRELCLEGEMVEALGLFSKTIRLGCAPNVVTYNTIIDGLCKTGNAAVALELHRELVHGKVGNLQESCKPYALVNGRCVEWPAFDTKLKAARITPDVVSYSCLIDGLCHSGMEEDANSLLVEMIDRGVHPNVVTFNIMINTLCRKRKVEQATGVLETMILRGEFPDIVTYSTIVNGYCRIGMVEKAMSFCKDMDSRGIFANNMTINTVLKALFDLKKVEDALSFFSIMKRMDANGAFPPNQVNYATMIDGMCTEGHIDTARELFLEMQGTGFSPDVFVYGSLIEGLCKKGQIGKAKEILSKMITSGVSPSLDVYNSLINGLCKEGHSDKDEQSLQEREYRTCNA